LCTQWVCTEPYLRSVAVSLVCNKLNSISKCHRILSFSTWQHDWQYNLKIMRHWNKLSKVRPRWNVSNLTLDWSLTETANSNMNIKWRSFCMNEPFEHACFNNECLLNFRRTIKGKRSVHHKTCWILVIKNWIRRLRIVWVNKVKYREWFSNRQIWDKAVCKVFTFVLNYYIQVIENLFKTHQRLILSRIWV